MKRITTGIVLSLLLSGLILWASASEAGTVAFVKSGIKYIDDQVLSGFMSGIKKDTKVVIVEDMKKAQIVNRIHEIRPGVIFVVGNEALEKVRNIKNIAIIAVVPSHPPYSLKIIVFESQQERI